MSRLDEFLRLLCGRFDNTRQLEELRRSGGPALPLAEHVNTVCNDKNDGLPGGKDPRLTPSVPLYGGGGGGEADILSAAQGGGRRRGHL